MIVYEVEESLEGVLSAVFESYSKREVPDIVATSQGYQMDLDTTIREIKTDDERVNRVKKAIMLHAGEHTVDILRVVMRSESKLKGTVCFNYIKEIIDRKKDIYFELANPVTIEFNSLKDKVWLEVHRFKGFLRFSETDKGVLYGHFSPDNDILELLAPHFTRRYKYHNFVLHDTKRNKVFMYDTKGYKIFTPTKPLTVYIGEVEEKCRSLYREYFDAVNIKSRPHEKQQRGYLPLRYRKNMTEFTGV